MEFLWVNCLPSHALLATAVLRQSVAFRITAFELQRMDVPNYRCQIDIFLLI